MSHTSCRLPYSLSFLFSLFSSASGISKLPSSIPLIFMMFYIALFISFILQLQICFYIISLCWISHFIHIMLSCLFSSMFYCSSLSFFKAAILNYQVNHRILSLSSVTRGLLKSFCDVMFHWFLVFLRVLHCCFLIWSSHLLQILLDTFTSNILFIGPAYNWDFLCPCRNTCAPCFLPPCGRNIKLLCLLSSLKLTTLAAENLHGLGLPKLALTAIHGSIHKDLAEELSVGLTFGALGMPAGQVGDPCSRFSQRFVVGFFLESWMQLGGIVLFWYTLIFLQPHLFSPQSCRYCLNTVGAAREKQVSSAASYTSREARQSPTVFPCGRNHFWLFSSMICHPGAGVALVKFLPAPHHLLLFFQHSARLSPQEIWRSTKALSFVSIYLIQHSPHLPLIVLRGAGADSDFWFHSLYQRLSAYYSMWVRLLVGPLAFGLDSTTTTEALLLVNHGEVNWG